MRRHQSVGAAIDSTQYSGGAAPELCVDESNSEMMTEIPPLATTPVLSGPLAIADSKMAEAHTGQEGGDGGWAEAPMTEDLSLAEPVADGNGGGASAETPGADGEQNEAVDSAGIVDISGGASPVPGSTPEAEQPVGDLCSIGDASGVGQSPVIDKIDKEATGTTQSEKLAANNASILVFSGQMEGALGELKTQASNIVGQVDGWVANASSQLNPGDVNSRVGPTFDIAKAAIEGGLADAPSRALAAKQTGQANFDLGQDTLDQQVDAAVTSARVGLDALALKCPGEISQKTQAAATQVEAMAGQYATKARAAAEKAATGGKSEDQEEKDSQGKAASQVGNKVAGQCMRYGGQIASVLRKRGDSAAQAVQKKVAAKTKDVVAAETSLKSKITSQVGSAKSAFGRDADSAAAGIESNRAAYLAQLDANQKGLETDATTEVEGRRQAIEDKGAQAKTKVPASVESLRTQFQSQLDTIEADAGSWAPKADPMLVQSKMDQVSADFDATKSTLKTKLDGKGADLQSEMDEEVAALSTNIDLLVENTKAQAQQTASDFVNTGEQSLLDLEKAASNAQTEVTNTVGAAIGPDIDGLASIITTTTESVGKITTGINTLTQGATGRFRLALTSMVDMIPRLVKGVSAKSPSPDLDDAGWQTLIDQQIQIQIKAQTIDPQLLAARIKDIRGGNRFTALRALRDLNPAQVEAVKLQFQQMNNQSLDSFVAERFDGAGHLEDAIEAYQDGNKLDGALAELREAADGAGLDEAAVGRVLSSLSATEIAELRQLAKSDSTAAEVLDKRPDLFDEASEDAVAAEQAIGAVDPSVWSKAGVDPNDLTTLAKLSPDQIQGLTEKAGIDREQLVLMMKQNGVSPDTYTAFDIHADPDKELKENATQAKMLLGQLEIDQGGARQRDGRTFLSAASDGIWGNESRENNEANLNNVIGQIEEAIADGKVDPEQLEFLRSQMRRTSGDTQRGFTSEMDRGANQLRDLELTRDGLEWGAKEGTYWVTMLETGGNHAAASLAKGGVAGTLEFARTYATETLVEERDPLAAAQHGARDFAFTGAKETLTTMASSPAKDPVTSAAADYLIGTPLDAMHNSVKEMDESNYKYDEAMSHGNYIKPDDAAQIAKPKSVSNILGKNAAKSAGSNLMDMPAKLLGGP
ncbi:MAG: apolipoprotein A1/A4/E family protein, partial [Proteobacteria bacterium]|nr:apolipoprotein A1/A4/E family protein [Pseudomonadota bacterium]